MTRHERMVQRVTFWSLLTIRRGSRRVTEYHRTTGIFHVFDFLPVGHQNKYSIDYLFPHQKIIGLGSQFHLVISFRHFIMIIFCDIDSYIVSQLCCHERCLNRRRIREWDNFCESLELETVTVCQIKISFGNSRC